VEYEVIQHEQLQGMRVLINDITYRSPHMHREFELLMVMRGELSISCRNRRFTVREGEAALMNPWLAHEFRAISEKATLLILQISPQFCKNYFPTIEDLRFDWQDLTELQNKAALRSELIQLSKAYFAMQPTYEFACMSRLNQIFRMLLLEVPWRLLDVSEKRQQNISNQRLERIINYIDANSGSKLLLSEIADREGLSVSYLSHFIHERLNMSYQDYLTLIRFEKGRLLVETSNLSVAEICQRCGFSDPRYFNEIYRKQLGCTPKEFRQSNLAGAKRTRRNPGSTQEHLYTEEEAKAFVFSL